MRENSAGTDYQALCLTKRPPHQDEGSVSTGSKRSACADLIQRDLAPGAGFFLVAGQSRVDCGISERYPAIPGFSYRWGNYIFYRFKNEPCGSKPDQ